MIGVGGRQLCAKANLREKERKRNHHRGAEMRIMGDGCGEDRWIPEILWQHMMFCPLLLRLEYNSTLCDC